MEGETFLIDTELILYPQYVKTGDNEELNKLISDDEKKYRFQAKY